MDQLHGFKLLSNIFLSFSTLYDVFFANFIILDLDPQEMNADPQPWFWHRGVRILNLSIRTEYFVKIEKFFYENILAYMRFWRFSLEKEKNKVKNSRGTVKWRIRRMTVGQCLGHFRVSTESTQDSCGRCPPLSFFMMMWILDPMALSTSSRGRRVLWVAGAAIFIRSVKVFMWNT